MAKKTLTTKQREDMQHIEKFDSKAQRTAYIKDPKNRVQKFHEYDMWLYSHFFYLRFSKRPL